MSTLAQETDPLEMWIPDGRSFNLQELVGEVVIGFQHTVVSTMSHLEMSSRLIDL